MSEHNWILIRLPESKNQTYILVPGETTLGRGATNSIQCTSLMASRFHCVITLKDCGNVYLRDLGSSNGTFINVEKSFKNRDVLLMEGDIIGLGVDSVNPFDDDTAFVLKLHKLSSQINVQQSRNNFSTKISDSIHVEEIINNNQGQSTLGASNSATIRSKLQASIQLPECSKRLRPSITTFQELQDISNEQSIQQSRKNSSIKIPHSIHVEEITIDDNQDQSALEASSSATIRSKHPATTQLPECSKRIRPSVKAFQELQDISNEQSIQQSRQNFSTKISDSIHVEEITIDDNQDQSALEASRSATIRSKHQTTSQLPECSKRIRPSVTVFQELQDLSNEQNIQLSRKNSSTKISDSIHVEEMIIGDIKDQTALEVNSSPTVRSNHQLSTELPECSKGLTSSVMAFQELQDSSNKQSTDTNISNSNNCDVTSSSKNTSGSYSVFTDKMKYVKHSTNIPPDIIVVSDPEKEQIVSAVKNIETIEDIVCVNNSEISRNTEKKVVTVTDKIVKEIEYNGRCTDTFEREMESCQGDLTKNSKKLSTDVQDTNESEIMLGRIKGNAVNSELEEMTIKKEEDCTNISSSYTVEDNIIVIDSDDEMPPSQLFVDPDIENEKEENDLEEIVDRLSNEDGYPLTSDDDSLDDAQEWYQKLSQSFNKVDDDTEKTPVRKEKEVESSFKKINYELQIMNMEVEKNNTNQKSIDANNILIENNQHKEKISNNLDSDSKVDIVGISSNKSKQQGIDHLLSTESKAKKRKCSDDYTSDNKNKKTKIKIHNKNKTPDIEIDKETDGKNNIKKKISSKEHKKDDSLKLDKKNVIKNDKDTVKSKNNGQRIISSPLINHNNDEIKRILAEKICDDFFTDITESEKISEIKQTKDILENEKVNEIKRANDMIKNKVVPRRRTISTEALPTKHHRSKSKSKPHSRLPIASTSSNQASVPKEKNDFYMSDPVNKNDQKSVKELRKEKLKELTKKNMQSCTSENKKQKSSASTNIKLTLKNRGAFLTEDIVSGPKSETNKSVGMPKDSKIHRNSNDSHENENLNEPKTNLNHSSNIVNKNNTNIVLNDKHDINDKFSKSLSDNAHNNLKPILRNCVVNVMLSKQYLKKKVHFEKEENLVKIKVFECLGSLLKKPTGYNKKDALPPENVPINGQQYEISRDIDHSSLIVISSICHWNTQWLEEQKKMPSNTPPPVFNGEIFDCKDEYCSFQDIQKTLFPLLIYELWSHLMTAWDQKRSYTYDISMENNSSLLQAFKVKNPSFSPEEHSKSLVYINCQTLLNNEDLDSNMYPRVGDVVIAEFSQRVNEKIDGKKSTCIAKAVFGYIYRANPNKITQNINHIIQYSMMKRPNAKIVLDMVMIVRGPIYTLDPSRLGRIRILKNLIPFLRNFRALDNLQFSPLLNRILCPDINNCIKMTALSNLIPYKGAPTLNETQRKAVQVIGKACLEGTDALHLIHGPPGTGKTQVIISLVMQQWLALVGRKHKAPPRILICAPSNAAIDEISLRLIKIKLTLERSKQFNLIRNGRKESVDPRVQIFTLDAMATNDINQNLESLNNTEMSSTEVDLLVAKINSLSFSLDSLKKRENTYSLQENQQKIVILEKKLTNSIRKKKEMDNYIETKKIDHHTFKAMKASREIELLENANIITTTLSSCFNSVMEKTFSGNCKPFTCCIIDEATQASEPETLIPLLLRVNNLILVGDPKQLPATVINMKAKRHGLDKSLFTRHRMWWYRKERSWYSGNRLMHFLDKQYRMHPEIIQWPSEYFYNSAVRTPQNIESKLQSPLLPYVVLSHTRDQNSEGELNCDEILIVKNLIESIVKSEDCRNWNIGVITPYNKQRTALKNDLRNYTEVEIGTVDSFQGRERDIIIFSCVRTDGVGFLSDTQRLNVALTRAKISLIICGNFKSLQKDGMWASLLKNAEKRNVLVNIGTLNPDFNLIRRRIM